MSELHFQLAVLLLLSVAVGLVRIFKGPTPANGILAVQLAGTGGAAILLTLAGTGAPGALLDVALVVALLAAATQIAFVAIHGAIDGPGQERRHD
ncbi:MAG: multiple resistance and pH regulation protein F [Desulfobacterales bacterium]|jgi:multicomponent Na+:H+ antiporter subunit F|nr:multiple resistance and pH regulation protein F [Desulfobacterales bacterium]